MDSKNKVTEFYLITGFLGAGKTTLLKNLIPLFDGKKLLVIMNEFGKEGVDGTLLEQRHIQLREINGGSVFCSCRLDQFEKVLTESLCLAPEVIIVEASGLSDPTNIRKILEEQEHTGALLYRGCICLVDAKQFRKVFSTARVCPRQLNTGDLILLNKSDLATAEERAEICILLHERYPRAVLHETTHGMISPAWLHGLIPSSRAVDSAGDKPNLTL
ncbi:MAG: GTP-binding protein, partial [Oscillospiraceae bacterium]